MSKARSFLGWLLQSFGPLIVFLVTKRFFGLRPAIALTLVWTLAELSYLLAWRRERPTAFFWFSAGITLVFGALDLYADAPVFFRYEAVLTNLLVGLYFGATVFAGKPLIQEFAEKAGTASLDRPGAREYLRLLTVAWAAFFFAKAALYLYLAESGLSFEEATAVRSVVGPVGFAVMLGGERVLRPLLLRGLRAVGWLPASAA
jgi:intracellular septation protein A